MPAIMALLPKAAEASRPPTPWVYSETYGKSGEAVEDGGSDLVLHTWRSRLTSGKKLSTKPVACLKGIPNGAFSVRQV